MKATMTEKYKILGEYIKNLVNPRVLFIIGLIFAFIVTRLNGKYSFKTKISEGVIPVGILMAFLSICIGLLNAGSMSY